MTHLLDGIDVLVCGLDSAGRILHLNQFCETVTGLPRQTIVGQSWLEIFAIFERRDSVVALWREAASDRAPAPFESLCRNNRRIRWQFSKWRAGPQEHGLCALGIDVTHERERLARAREAERTIAVGNLSAGLAHEIRNPLNSAQLQLKVAEKQIARANLERAILAVKLASSELDRAGALLHDFLVFARPRKVDLKRVDLRAIAASAVDEVNGAAERPVRIELEPGPSAQLEADEEQVKSAIVNLLTNAVDAVAPTERSGSVVVRLRVDGNMSCVEVEDDGPGLPSSDAPIFDAFFTTKPTSTGLGLAIVQRVAFDHGGTIFHERRGDRTVFILRLPIVFGSS